MRTGEFEKWIDLITRQSGGHHRRKLIPFMGGSVGFCTSRADTTGPPLFFGNVVKAVVLEALSGSARLTVTENANRRPLDSR